MGSQALIDLRRPSLDETAPQSHPVLAKSLTTSPVSVFVLLVDQAHVVERLGGLRLGRDGPAKLSDSLAKRFCDLVERW